MEAEKKTEKISKLMDNAKDAAERAQKQYEETLQMLLEKKDLEREKALVELERHQQEKIAAQNTKHNEEIRSLYDEVAELRQSE